MSKNVNAKQLMALGFAQCASVWSGGKPWFYCRFTAGMRQRIFWNRIDQTWVYEITYMPTFDQV